MYCIVYIKIFKRNMLFYKKYYLNIEIYGYFNSYYINVYIYIFENYRIICVCYIYIFYIRINIYN